jgi:large subunit ribosomal protein L10
VKLQQKQQISQELHDKLTRSKVLIVTDYKGLDVQSMNALRRKLREADIEYRVVKNTLLRRASEETDAALIKEHFIGPSAIAISYEDPVAPAKVLTEFAKEHKHLEIKAGVMEGKALDLDAIKALSALPSREVLLGKLLSVINGVPTNMVRALNAIPQQLLTVLQAVQDQKAQAEQ